MFIASGMGGADDSILSVIFERFGGGLLRRRLRMILSYYIE